MEKEKFKLLEVDGLTKRVGSFCVKNVSFSLEAGFIMGFIGRNGAGKSTTMKLIQNVIVKDQGKVTICGYDNRKQEVLAKNQIGFVMGDCPFIKTYTLMENGELFGKYYKSFDINQFSMYLKRFDLDERKKIIELSKGMESRFQLAFALAHDPKLLILDEPTDGLDPIFRREFLQLLQELIEHEKMGILLSTHITSDLDKIADYITMIDNGEILFSKDKEKVMDQYHIIKGGHDLLQRIPADSFVGIRRFTHGFEGLTSKTDKIKVYFKENENLVVEQASLDDILYYYSKRRIL